MSALHIFVVLLPASGALAMLFVIAFAFSGPRVRGRRAFGVFSIFVGLWCLAAAAEYLSVELAMREFFGLSIYVGAAATPVAWFIFTCRYAARDRWLTRRVVIALFILPVVTVVLAYTNRLHGLIWSEVAMVMVPIPDLDITHGWWFRRVHLPYSYLMTVLGLVALVSRFFGDIASYRSQILGVMLSATFVFLLNVAHTSGGFDLYGLDPTPLAASVFTFGLAVSLFRGFLGRSPLSYREIFMASGEGLILLDGSERIVDINPAASALATLASPVGRSLDDAFPWLYASTEAESDERKSTDSEIEALAPTAQRDESIYSVRQLPLLGSGGVAEGAVVLLREVTAELRERSALQVLARIDSLTQVLNRGAFVTVLSERLADRPREWSLALLFIDLDQFKQINDRHGHAAGDEVLCETGRRVEKVLRPGDVLGRLGGDEFAVLLDRADETVAAALAARLAGQFEAAFLLPGVQLRVGASIGYAVWPHDSDDVDGLLDIADRRMYRLKNENRPAAELGS